MMGRAAWKLLSLFVGRQVTGAYRVRMPARKRSSSTGKTSRGQGRRGPLRAWWPALAVALLVIV
ncbi:hypothetical protein KJ554_11220, partial [bacterium]|nr:hypothetical protein [bacterium]